MAYQQSNISALSQIPGIVAAFAQTQGWTVTTGTGVATFKHPTLAGALEMQLSSSISGTNNQNHDLIWEEVNGTIAQSRAVCRSPKLAGTSNNPTVPNPTNLHVFCSLVPEPFIAIAIEYGPNLYRHSYFGYPMKAGVYNGGEIISGMAGSSAFFTTNLNCFDDAAFKMLFNSRHSTNILGSADCGGMHLDAVDNPVPWRVFQTPTSNQPFASFNSDDIIGGFGDGINDGYMARGNSSYASASILSNINLYAAEPITNDTLFIPVGSPVGVRHVNMENLEPGQLIDIAGTNWRVFPAASKSNLTAMTSSPAVGYYRDFETSFYVGLAYLES